MFSKNYEISQVAQKVLENIEIAKRQELEQEIENGIEEGIGSRIEEEMIKD